MTSALIIDDHPVMRMGLKSLLTGADDIDVCGEAGTAAAGLEAVEKDKPELVLLDLSLPDRGGLELLKDILSVRPKTYILVVSSHDESVYAERALRGGARGYVMKEEAGDRLIDAVRAVAAGQIYVSERITGLIVEIFSGNRASSSDPTSVLTDRELEVFTNVGKGLGSKEMGELLGISARTVDAHRAHIKEKLGFGDAKELLREAVRWSEANNS